MTEAEMAGWHHQQNGHESEQTPGDSEGQGTLACCSPWGRQESDTTWELNNSGNTSPSKIFFHFTCLELYKDGVKLYAFLYDKSMSVTLVVRFIHADA